MILIKLGGNALASASDSSWLDAIEHSQKAGERIVIVHGGGPQIDEEFRVHDIAKVVVGGYRVTDERSFGLVEMVLAGKVQQTLVRAMRSRSLPAVGITGSDGNLLQARKKNSPQGDDLGQVGEIERVNPHLLEVLLDAGFLPVISPVSSDLSGVGFNVNADLAAGAVAGALKVERAIFMTDVAGIYRNFPDATTLIDHSTLNEMRALLPTLSEGMVPKVEAVINALTAGAKSVHVIDGRDGVALAALLSGKKAGTEILND
jgi:acetylglutamate kinase